MAHEVYQIEDEQSMAFTGDVPWHGLGQAVDPSAPLEVWARQAHLDWTVAMAPVQYDIGGEMKSYKERSVIYREDSRAPMAVVGSDYKPVQPLEVLEFFRKSVEESGFKIETAGSLKGGRRVWALANTGRELRLGGQDLIRAYLLLATSYDTTLRTTAAFTAIRVVCNNTLSFAYSVTEDQEKKGQGGVVKVGHRSTFDGEKVYGKLGLIDGSWEKFGIEADLLSQRKVGEDAAVRFFVNLLHNKKMADDYSGVPKRTVAALLRIYNGGVGSHLKAAEGTAWGLVNAVTRFYDHERGSRNPDNRLDSAWFGDGASIKQRAWADALELAA
jgi:phage/plasmid-like protein (TIGR03299 family)